jgi:hypothetical protein
LAINPPGDIILGVARAADPLKHQAAMDRLARIGGSPSTGAGAQPVSSALPSEPASPATADGPRMSRPVSALSVDRRPDQLPGASDALSQFEAFVLQSFVQTMLPKHADNVFGRGTAGEVWKSMMAEMLAGELARSGRVGIARQIAEHSTVPGAAARPAASLQDTLAYLTVPPPDWS